MVELVYTYVSEAYALQLASSSLASGTKPLNSERLLFLNNAHSLHFILFEIWLSLSMNEYYENIKNKTVCTECGGKEMAFGYIYEANGSAVKKLTTVLGIPTYRGAANMLMIICNKCGLVNKSYVYAR